MLLIWLAIPGSLTHNKAVSMVVINATSTRGIVMTSLLWVDCSSPSTQVWWELSIFPTPHHQAHPFLFHWEWRVCFACLIVLFIYLFIYLPLKRSSAELVLMNQNELMYSRRCPPFNPGHTDTQELEALVFPWELCTLRLPRSQWVWFWY